MSTDFHSHLDLLNRAPYVAMATISPSGTPQLTALWFLVEDGTENQFATVEVRGTAVNVADQAQAVAEDVLAKYGSNVFDMDKPGEQRLAFRIDVRKVIE